MIEEIGGIKCHLDLGARTRRTLTELLQQVSFESHSRSEKLTRLATSFIGTPFRFESALPEVQDDCVRVCLSSFDCITLIYNLVALANAESFEEYVEQLVAIRYVSECPPRISNRCEHGTLFDFACEALLENALNRRVLEDLTTRAMPNGRLLTVRVRLSALARPREHDPLESIVSPRFGERVLESQFIPSQKLDLIDKNVIRSGDLVVFTLGGVNRDGSPRPLLVRHAGVVMKVGDELFFIHATKDFFWRPGNRSKAESNASGLYLNDDPEKEFIGVGIAGEYAGDELTTNLQGASYFGYHQSRPRLLSNYAQENFIGVKFLRVLD